jgi:hypothetical protein
LVVEPVALGRSSEVDLAAVKELEQLLRECVSRSGLEVKVVGDCRIDR